VAGAFCLGIAGPSQGGFFSRGRSMCLFFCQTLLQTNLFLEGRRPCDSGCAFKTVEGVRQLAPQTRRPCPRAEDGGCARPPARAVRNARRFSSMKFMPIVRFGGRGPPGEPVGPSTARRRRRRHWARAHQGPGAPPEGRGSPSPFTPDMSSRRFFALSRPLSR